MSSRAFKCPHATSTRWRRRKRRVLRPSTPPKTTYPDALPYLTRSCNAMVRPSPSDHPGARVHFLSRLTCISLYYVRTLVVGNQIRSLYRHGRGSECSDKWDDVKFCLSLKSLEEEQRRKAWLRHRAEWWARRRIGRSSEDVWDVRTYASSVLLCCGFTCLTFCYLNLQ